MTISLAYYFLVLIEDLYFFLMILLLKVEVVNFVSFEDIDILTRNLELNTITLFKCYFYFVQLFNKIMKLIYND
jgi:hypothetical protein